MKGQTLIEVLAALGIITIIATVLAAVVVTSQRITGFSKDQKLATDYAQEGIEIMHQKRDNDYVSFRDFTGTYCLDGGSSVLDSDCPTAANITDNGNNFLRKVTIAQDGCDDNIAKVTVEVSWQDSKCPASNLFCHKAQMITCLSTVNLVPTL